MGDRGKHEDLQMAIWMSMQHTTPEPFKKRKERNILQKMKKRALVSPFLLDDSAEDMDESCLGDPPGSGDSLFAEDDCSNNSYDMLKDIDLVAANRIHPNNHRKVGVYVEQRVDCMMYEGLLNEVYNIYNLNAVYTRGLRQAIGVREFEPLLRTCVVKDMYERERELTEGSSIEKGATLFNRNLMELVRSSSNTEPTILLEEAIEKVKLNTRRLVRRQACGDRVLRGLHEWEQHKQGRGHRKRISRLKSKGQVPGFVEEKDEYSACEQNRPLSITTLKIGPFNSCPTWFLQPNQPNQVSCINQDSIPAHGRNSH
ncbi:hypothetical protein JHK87_033119 [Glycine soja]|nr:hypothetical protein JHK87_033119 [Glycine soja]